MDQSTLISVSLAVYVTASVYVAAVRWGHRCAPYAKHMDYYYPAWKTVVFCYLANLFMLPALFMPTDADALLQLRLLLILASPFFCAVLMFSYFGKVLKITAWRRPVYILAVPFGLMALTATVLALEPGQQMTPEFCRWFFSLGGILGAFFMVCFVTAFHMIARALRRFSEENYSNPDDFPRKYASGVIWIALTHLLISWTASFIGTPHALSHGLIALSVLSLVLLIGILSPHRAMDVEKLDSGEHSELPVQEPITEEDSDSDEEIVLPEDRQLEIAGAIRSFMEEKKGYLDSHLTLTSLSKSISTNRKYVSIVMKTQLGGFFSYVNRCRLSHAAQLQAEHPDWPLSAVIADSGFASRTTYYKVRRQLEN